MGDIEAPADHARQILVGYRDVEVLDANLLEVAQRLRQPVGPLRCIVGIEIAHPELFQIGHDVFGSGRLGARAIERRCSDEHAEHAGAAHFENLPPG